ncbi:outer membrane usher protein [Pantoea sp. BAV 3049]|uniref:outer membrane usher protein n=1 Tax=Pantoea sp. BAV 3049 TaxID=2654188 RepID=UPI00131D787D|nr:outer membrane usher protein [Pantoea sp. BAV 3049]
MKIKYLTGCILIVLSCHSVIAAEEGVEFNTDVLDVKERANIDLSQFSRAGYVMPGEYTLSVHINKSSLQEENITFLRPDNHPDDSVACLSPALVNRFGFKEEILKKLTWWHNGQCLNTESDVVRGMTVRGDLATSTLFVSIPQAWLEYTSATWDPPSRWDDGIPGIIADYNASLMSTRSLGDGTSSNTLSGNGTVGANLGAWRLRADWQGTRSQTQGSGKAYQKWQWSRYYLYRAIRSLRAKLVVGEDYLDSDLFDNPRFAGIRLVSDDSQLPPNLRGYAPEVSGVARTNAKVTVSQQGRVLYESQVAPGPFQIQSLSDTTHGTLDVTVQEQDGTVQKFQVNTASVPYLSRPGMVRYKLATGRPDDLRHRVNGPLFTTGEFSWGVNNGWSVYGGSMIGNQYQAISGGVGRDLLAFGAMSVDMSTARADLSRQGSTTGNSYRLSYSKAFDSLDSQVTFAGYRFSQRTYMSLSEFLDARELGMKSGGSKQMYTVSFNKQFRSIGLSSYFNISRQTYWNDVPPDIRYSLSMSKYFDFGKFKNVSIALSAYQNRYRNTQDRGGYLTLSLPLGDSDTLSYSGNVINGVTQQTASYFSVLDEHNSYQVSAGGGQAGMTGNAAFVHQGSMAELDASAGWQAGSYMSGGLSLRGGMTATAHGAALHRISRAGGTRLMLDTEGVAGVPVHGYGSTEDTNMMGVAVISDVNSYYHNEASIDLNHLPDDVSAIRSVSSVTLTDGAIGYRSFDVLSGKKGMVMIAQSNGKSAPFGATVKNGKGQQTGLVGDEGETWLSGMNPGERMEVQWDGKTQCTFTLPARLDVPSLLLPCQYKAG